MGTHTINMSTHVIEKQMKNAWCTFTTEMKRRYGKRIRRRERSSEEIWPSRREEQAWPLGRVSFARNL